MSEQPGDVAGHLTITVEAEVIPGPATLARLAAEAASEPDDDEPE